MGRTNPDQRMHTGRSAYRPERIGAESEHRKAGRHCGARAAAGAAGVAGQPVWIQGQAAGRAVAEASIGGGKLRHIGLAEHDRTGGTQPCDHRRVGRGLRVVQCRAAGRGWQSRGVDIVLDHHRDAMQRTPGTIPPPFTVQPSRLAQRVGVQVADRIDRRAVAIERLDACQVACHQLFGGQRAGVHAARQFRDRQFEDIGCRGHRAGGRRISGGGPFIRRTIGHRVGFLHGIHERQWRSPGFPPWHRKLPPAPRMSR